MTYIPGAPFHEFEPSNHSSVDRAMIAFFACWFGTDLPQEPEKFEERVAEIEAATGVALSHSVRCLVRLFVGIEAALSQSPERDLGHFDARSPGWAPERFEPCDAYFLLRIGDDSFGYDHYGIPFSELGSPDPIIEAWTYDEEHGEWGKAFGGPLSGRRCSTFLMLLLLRHAPGQSVIGEVFSDRRFGFLQSAQDILGMPCEADGVYFFEGKDDIVAQYYWPELQSYAVEFLHRTGAPVSAGIETLLSEAHVQGAFAT